VRKVKALLLFLAAIIAFLTSMIFAGSVITISYPQMDPNMAIEYKIIYSVGFAAFPIAFFILSIFLFIKGISFLKARREIK